MSAKRIAALCLTVLLAGLFVRCLIADVGDLKTRGLLLIGSVLGAIYATHGSLPTWIIERSGGRLAADDDPANLSPRVYLAVLPVAIVVAGIALTVGLAVL